MTTLLIAGPFTWAHGEIGPDGAGAWAAGAAAPFAHTQWWGRGPAQTPAPVRQIMERRGLDLAGFIWDGVDAVAASLLPEVEPTSADGLAAVLLIGLPAADLTRALDVVTRLPGRDQRTVVVAPAADVDADGLKAIATVADIIVLPLATARAATATADALAAVLAIRKLGVKTVVVTAGMLGGVLCYGDRVVNWPVSPVAEVPGPAGRAHAAFAGALAAWTTSGADFNGIKRACAVASGSAALAASNPRGLWSAKRDELIERFERQRRLHKA
jgi:sugar/nucleoside kinase (ribokinase family)